MTVDRPEFEIDLDAALDIKLPDLEKPLRTCAYKTPDGRAGWALRISDGRPIATPAYENGLLFVGGGYGSYEFYAFDAESGELAWEVKTADDGPTAAVVEGGYVAFNTESCTIMVLRARTGEVVWEEWLGDPLMSQPAIYRDRIFMAYPADQRKPLFRPGMGVADKQKAIAEAKESGGHGWRSGHEHRLLCADLTTGTHLWEQVIAGDAITAPVINEGKVFLNCLDGTSFCLNAEDGELVWKKEEGATSAPIVANGEVVYTEKRVDKGRASEGVRRRRSQTGETIHEKLHAEAAADYLTETKSGGVGIKASTLKDLDAKVGFSSAPSSAKLHAASKHLGTSSVSSAWAYQGSRTSYAKGRILNAQGLHLNCLRASDGTHSWRARSKSKGLDEDDQAFVPPSLGRESLYLCSTIGHLASLRQDDGDVNFLYSTRQPISFQAALARGGMYVGTSNGLLLRLDTGSEDADGWYMWGGNAQHNKCD